MGWSLLKTALNSNTNDKKTVFGGTETVAGTLSQYRLASKAGNDTVFAKYLDKGSVTTVSWVQTGTPTSA